MEILQSYGRACTTRGFHAYTGFFHSTGNCVIYIEFYILQGHVHSTGDPIIYRELCIMQFFYITQRIIVCRRELIVFLHIDLHSTNEFTVCIDFNNLTGFL